MKETKINLKEENGIYYFEGKINMTEMFKNKGVQLDENCPKLWKNFNCTLTFATSKVQEPIMDINYVKCNEIF